jgi:phospholipid-binding lipoprotein MlaA
VRDAQQRPGRAALALAALLAVAAATGCASGNGPRTEGDPWEGMNRPLFAVHDGIDTWVFAPLSKGWRFITPEFLRDGVRNFFSNVRYPVVFANHLFQGKLRQAGTETGRFVVNSTVGLAGFFDPATGWGMPRVDEDFGQTLGVWGVGPGPYLVIPVFGPTSVRDVLANVVDAPLAIYPFFVPWYVSSPARLLYGINVRSYFIEDIEEARSSSFDYYAFLRNAYLSNRQAQVEDQGEQARDRRFEELYYPEDTDE